MARTAHRFDRGLFPVPAWYKPRSASLSGLVQAFLFEHVGGEGLAEGTHTVYTQALSQWLAWCATHHVDDPRQVSPETLTVYATFQRTRPATTSRFASPARPQAPRPLSEHTVSKYLRALRTLFAWAELHGYVELSPFRRWKLRQPTLPVQRGFTAEEVRRMVAATHVQSELARRDRAIVLLLWDTGLRVEELVGLQVAHVLSQGRLARTVTVHGKFDRERLLELHPQTQRALAEYLVHERPDGRTDALFVGRDGAALTTNAVRLLVRRLARRAGLSGQRLSPHTFRHGFTRAYLEQEGARVDDLQILLGHRSLAMTLHYAGQVAAQARRGARSYSPVNQLDLALGKRIQRGRPRKSP